MGLEAWSSPVGQVLTQNTINQVSPLIPSGASRAVDPPPPSTLRQRLVLLKAADVGDWAVKLVFCIWKA